MKTAQAPAATGYEALLPDDWNRSIDLLVLVGEADPAQLAELVARGQARIVLYTHGDPPQGIDAVRPAPQGTVEVRSPVELLTAVQELPGAPPERLIVHRTAGTQLPDGLLDDVALTLRDAVQSRRINRNTAERFGKLWARQGLANLEHVARHPSVDALRGAFAGQPAVIVSPGPSLATNGHLLREVGGRAVVMTCSHALAVVEDLGVVPDLVVASDPQDLSRHFEGYDLTRPSALVLDATVRPAHFGLDARRVFTFASNVSVQRWFYEHLGEDACLVTGGSVACTQLSLALAMGCDPIVFVGQDLSFPGHRYYVGSSIDGRSELELDPSGRTFVLHRPASTDPRDARTVATRPEDVLEVEGWDGGRVPTSTSFFTFLRWFEAAAKSVATGTRLYNCTEGGARIGGMQQRRLADVVAEWPERSLDVEARIAAAHGRPEPARAERVARRVEEMLAALDRCVEIARRCDRLAAAAVGDRGLLERLDAAEKDLARSLVPVQFISMIAQDKIHGAQERAVAATTLEENLRAARDLFGVVLEAGATLRATMRDAVESIRGGPVP